MSDKKNKKTGKIINFIKKLKKDKKIVTNKDEYNRLDNLAKELVDVYFKSSKESFFSIGLPSKDLLTSLTSKIGLSFLNFNILNPFFILRLYKHQFYHHSKKIFLKSSFQYQKRVYLHINPLSHF